MGFEIKGLKELQRKLDNLAKKADNLDGNHSVPFDELFNKKFMQSYTSLESIDSFVEKSGFDFSDMDSIDENELNIFVNENTKFSTWDEMKTKAAEEWTAKKLGF